ncbi:hypothetical protein EVC45_31210 [Paraburkholderia sp. UYCP14C]|uniref:hypothetical protein n=1 Tax=Paraburkholderia sp. UYCP14C TaxID=2511130 RepID=UPI001020F269|nr:hypothetical protein [Paraburkholderia sp. UYCP14C]RZF25883.1 hypothetical protein EVC45_31210 [Paraburkholderia sp. UYCP14C]
MTVIVDKNSETRVIMGKKFSWSVAALAVAVASSAAWAAEDPSIACFAAMADNPAFAPLRGKVVLKLGAHPDLSMLANDHRPTKREKDAIAAWVAESERCYDLGHDYRAIAYQPVVSALIDESMHAIEALVAKLYAGKLTYAQFNQQRQATDDTYRERVASTLQTLQAESDREQANRRAQQASIEAQQKAAAAQEAATQAQAQANEEAAQNARRALALQMLANSRPIYTPLPPPPPIRTPSIQNTNCYQIGSQLHCTTTGN